MTTSNPIKFVPNSRKSQILDTQVERIFIVAHEQPFSTGTNKWYLCVPSATHSTRSIGIDCQPLALTDYCVSNTNISGFSRAEYTISELELSTQLPLDERVHFILDVEPGISVRRIMEIITINGRGKYEFDPVGGGCRNWVTDSIDLLFGIGALSDVRQVIRAKDGIKDLRSNQR